jgi:hypothetical protein
MDNTHNSALIAKHAGLEARISDEARRPSPDTTLLVHLKKQKLRIKESLSRV